MKKDINDVLEEMKQLDKLSERYADLWEIVILKYSRLFHKKIGQRPNHEDIYQEIVMKLPEWIDEWDNTKASFITHLVWQLRGFIQNLMLSNQIVYFNNTGIKSHAKAKNKESLEYSIVHVEVDYESKDFHFVDREEYKRKSNPTVEKDLDFETYIKMIKDVEFFDWWYDHYFNEKTLKDIAKENRLSKERIRQRIKVANEKIKNRLSRHLKE